MSECCVNGSSISMPALLICSTILVRSRSVRRKPTDYPLLALHSAIIGVMHDPRLPTARTPEHSAGRSRLPRGTQVSRFLTARSDRRRGRATPGPMPTQAESGPLVTAATRALSRVVRYMTPASCPDALWRRRARDWLPRNGHLPASARDPSARVRFKIRDEPPHIERAIGV